MTLRTVKVPKELEPLFQEAEKLVSLFFASRRDDPAHGTIEIGGERYLLVRAASLSVEFFDLVRELFGPERLDEADDFARNILFDLAHAVGLSDARRFHENTGVDDPLTRLAAGPIHFAHTGWAFVDIQPDAAPAADDSYQLVYDHPYSFEADAWLKAERSVDFPVCIMNAGYSSGWCEESFGIRLVASEVLCRARGDVACRFVMAPPTRIEERIQAYIEKRPHLASHKQSPQVPDLFARKRIEDELRRARDELEERVEERTQDLRSTNEKLRQAMQERRLMESKLLQKHTLEAIGRLAGGVAHDFNNLMTVVIGQADSLQRELDEDDPRRLRVLDVLDAGERAAELTRQLLTFSRSQTVQPELVDLGEVVAGMQSMLDRLIDENIRLEIQRTDEPVRVYSDPGHLTQILLNLAVNARDAMPNGGVLRIETARLDPEQGRPEPEVAPGSWARLSVSDTGIGMDEETQRRIFDPFFTTKEETVGTGLGLSTAFGIVTQTGGTITVSSKLGEGTRLNVYMPLADRPSAPALGGRELTDMPPGKETVLVLEDQDVPRRMVVSLLRELGYTVHEAATSEEALRLASEHPSALDLLLTDVLIPHMSGPVVARRISGMIPGIAVLYMSGYVDQEALGLDYDEHSPELIQKPFTPAYLAQCVRRVLDSREDAQMPQA